MEISLDRDEVIEAILIHIFVKTGMRIDKDKVNITFKEDMLYDLSNVTVTIPT